jgi:thioredoxin-related protein
VIIFSSKKDDLKSISKFITKYNLKSTILHKANNIEEKYHISGYPNYFIISPTGKIINVINGYAEGIEEHIIELIDNYLK